MLPAFFGQNDIIHTVPGSPSGRHKADVVVEDYQGKFDFSKPSFPALDAVYLSGVGYRFNLRNLFKNYGGFSMQLPSSNMLAPMATKGNIVKARVRVQSVGNTSLYENVSKTFAILNGGMSENDFARLGNQFFETWSKVKGPFLTWQPKLKKIELQSPEHLYWLQNISDTEISITVQYTVVRTDPMGFPTYTATLTTVINKTLVVKPYELACIPVRPQIFRELDSNIDPNGIRKISVQVLYSAASYTSEIRVFDISDGISFSKAPNTDTPIFFKILNSFGVWDDLRCYGKIIEGTETERFMVDYDRRRTLLDVEGFDTITVNTGALDVGWLKYMKQLLYARKIYQVVPYGHREVVLESKSLKTLETMVPNENATLEFRYVETNTNYSAL
jgi:hypothetical protein